jgi:Chromate transporter
VSRSAIEAEQARRARRPARQPGGRDYPSSCASGGASGCIGFGGPPAHIALLRELCVTRRGWLDDREFEDAIAATNLLPGPASTQLAIHRAWRLRGIAGALVGGVSFIVPGLVLILDMESRRDCFVAQAVARPVGANVIASPTSSRGESASRHARRSSGARAREEPLATPAFVRHREP